VQFFTEVVGMITAERLREVLHYDPPRACSRGEVGYGDGSVGINCAGYNDAVVEDQRFHKIAPGSGGVSVVTKLGKHVISGHVIPSVWT
jgi:hypothetical protein